MTTSEIYSDWKLVSLSALPDWALALCLLAVILAAVLPFVLRRGKAAKRGRSLQKRVILACLRGLGCLALAFLLVEPGIRYVQSHKASPQVAILVDTSASMNLPANPQGDSRKSAVVEWIAQNASNLQKQGIRTEVFGFSSALSHPMASTELGNTAFDGDVTDILGAIQSAVSGPSNLNQGRPSLGAVLLISDGMDTSKAKSLSSDDRKHLEALGVPISTVLVGAKKLPDVSVDRVAADGFAFVRSPTSITAYIRATGFDGQVVPVTLKMDGKPYATREVTLLGGDAPATSEIPVRFDFSPDQTGDFACSVEVPVLAAETIRENNGMPFSFKVIRDRVRILHVAGRPTWDMRFLRSRFSDSPNIDLVSSYILRDATDDIGTDRDGELALIPFPVQEIFHDQLATFDVVVIQNFSLEERSYAMKNYLPGIAQYVLDGGALVLIGGENSFGEGHYEKTPLGPLLPVEVTSREPTSDPFQARLTPLGKKHPIMQVSPVASDALAAWETLPAMDGVHVTRAKKGASVLLEHPFETVDGENVPVVVVQESGKGRVMGIMSDASWQWAFDSGSGQRIFDRFWSQAIRWLVRDGNFSPVKVFLGTDATEVGKGVSVRVESQRADYAKAAGAQVVVRARRVDDLSEEDQWSVSLVADDNGMATTDFVPPVAGAWRLEAVSFDGQHPENALGRDSQALAALPKRGAENASLDVGEKFLREIAWVTGGKFSSWSDPQDPQIPMKIQPLDEDAEEMGRRRALPHREWAFGVLCLTLLAQWWLSRRWGSES